MAIEINLATYDKQLEILKKVKDSGVNYFYTLASFDSEASQSDIESLKGLEHINNIKQSETATRAIVGSDLCMLAIINSQTAMSAYVESRQFTDVLIDSDKFLEMLLKSSFTEEIKEEGIITGRFLPLFLTKHLNISDHKAYNGEWSTIPEKILGGWLKENRHNPIATQMTHRYFTGRQLYCYNLGN